MYSIPKTWKYVDSIDASDEIMRHLQDILQQRNPKLAKGLILPFNARMSLAYRNRAMDDFRQGTTRIMICKGAAGMVSGLYVVCRIYFHGYTGL